MSHLFSDRQTTSQLRCGGRDKRTRACITIEQVFLLWGTSRFKISESIWLFWTYYDIFVYIGEHRYLIHWTELSKLSFNSLKDSTTWLQEEYKATEFDDNKTFFLHPSWQSTLISTENILIKAWQDLKLMFIVRA